MTTDQQLVGHEDMWRTLKWRVIWGIVVVLVVALAVHTYTITRMVYTHRYQIVAMQDRENRELTRRGAAYAAAISRLELVEHALYAEALEKPPAPTRVVVPAWPANAYQALSKRITAIEMRLYQCCRTPVPSH